MNIFITLSVIFWSLFPSLISYTQGSQPPQKIKLTNLISNGNFSHGINEYVGYYNANISIENDYLKVIKAQASNISSINYKKSTGIIGHKYYYSISIKTSGTDAFDYGGVYNIIDSNDTTQSMRSQPRYFSGVGGQFTNFTRISSLNTLTYIEANTVTRFYISTNGAKNSIYYIDDLLLIDLTSCYGLGNEPSKAFIDELINRVGYFEGDYYYSTSLGDNYKWFTTGFVEKTGERDFIDYLGFFVWLAVPPISLYLLYKLIKGVIYD